MSGPWACKGCGIRGHYRTSDPSKCAQRWGEWPSTFTRSATASGLRWERVAAKPARGRELCSARASGREWEDSGVTKPPRGVELIHGDLATALASKTEFSQQEWDAFSIPCGALRMDHFIRSGEKYFTPIASLAIALKNKPASGLKWKKISATMPAQGRDLGNPDLAKALTTKIEFTQQEWEAFGIGDMRHDDFIRTDDDAYFRASEIEFTPQEFGAFGISNLRLDQFIKAGDAYFKPAELAGDCKICGKHADEHLPQHADAFVGSAASGVCQKCKKMQGAHFGTRQLCVPPDMYCFPKYQRIAAHNSNCKRCGKKEVFHEGLEKYCDARRCCMCWFKGPGEDQHLKDLSCKTCSTRSEAVAVSSADTPPQPAEQVDVDHEAQIAVFAEFFKTELGLPDPSEGEDYKDAEDLAKACVEYAHLRSKSATDMRVLYLMPEIEVCGVFELMPAAQKAYTPVILEALRACKERAASTPREPVEANRPMSEWMEAMGLDTATAEAVSQKFEAHEAGKVQKLAERRLEALMTSQYDIQKKKCLPYVREVLEDMKLNDSQWNERLPTDKLERLRDVLKAEFFKADSDSSGHLTEEEFNAMGTLKAIDDVKKAEAFRDLKDKDGIKEEIFNIAPVCGVPEITKGLVLAVEPSEAKTMAFSLPRTARHIFLDAVVEAIKEKKKKDADAVTEPRAEAPPSDDAKGESKRTFLISTDGLSKTVPEWLRDTVPDMFDEATILVVQHACRENRVRTSWSLMSLESELNTIFSATLPHSVIKMLRQAIKRDPRRSQTKWKVDASLPSLKGKVKIYAPQACGNAENGEGDMK